MSTEESKARHHRTRSFTNVFMTGKLTLTFTALVTLLHMEIQFMVEDLGPSDGIAASVTKLLSDIAKQMKCPEDLLQRVIIADEVNFGSAIAELSPGTPYTNNEDYTAVAKVLMLEKPDRSESVGIVFRDFIIGGAFTALPKNASERSADEQRFLYVLFHEMAHARDHAERPVRDATINFVSDYAGRFKIKHVAAFYSPVVIDEAIACYFSALACNQAMFDDEMESAHRVVERQLAALTTETARYIGDQTHLRKIAFDSANAFWLPFVQHGKLIAHLQGGSHLAARLWMWKDARPGVVEVIQEYAALLNTVFKAYPAIPSDFAERLFTLWQSMGTLHGFSFLEHPWSGDGVMWK